jgi:hypothetical protein
MILYFTKKVVFPFFSWSMGSNVSRAFGSSLPSGWEERKEVCDKKIEEEKEKEEKRKEMHHEMWIDACE